MKIWWEYTCDFGHTWELLRSENAEERPEDRVCEYGHEAVVRKLCRPADLVEASIYPATRIVDYKTKQIGVENRFYVILRAADESWWDISSVRYTKEEALEIVGKFAGLSIEVAKKLWAIKKRPKS